MTSQPRGSISGRRRPGRGQRPTPDDTLVAWANVGKIQPAHIALLQECYEEKVDVIHVQEPWTGYPTKTQSHPGYEVYAPVDTWGDTDERPRVLTYVRKGAKLQVQQRRPSGVQGSALDRCEWGLLSQLLQRTTYGPRGGLSHYLV